MKAILVLFALTSFAASAAAHEVASAPEALKVAEVCEYESYHATMTCQDLGGNYLFENFRVYPKHKILAYPMLPVFTMMKQNGFSKASDREIAGVHTVLFFKDHDCR